jgi:hypothetical protein
MQRPTAVTLFGILNVVFGVFALFGVFGVFALQAMNDLTKNPVVKIMHENPAYATWVKCTIPLSLVSFALLTASGIGLLGLREWARKLAIGYAIYGILLDIAVAFANYHFVFRPLFAKISESNGSSDPAMMGGAIGAGIGGLMGGVFGLIYPVLLLVFMMRKEIIAAFRPPQQPPVLPSV